jgi:hypothetical protein
MAHAEQISTLRRRRSALIGRMAQIRRHFDTYKENEQVDEDYLIVCHKAFEDNWAKILAVQAELEALDAEENDRLSPLWDDYFQFETRLSGLKRAPTPAKVNLPQRESVNESEPASLKLPDIPLTPFSGSIEEWEHFHDVFAANVDRNESLSAVKKFQYLKAALTGKAAQSIQLLEVTGANYPIALNILKERFDYHRRVCMRHWNLIKNILKSGRKRQKPLKTYWKHSRRTVKHSLN